MNRYANRSRRGFSLVELAVVVIIIGVLAAFGVPRFRDSVERSKCSEAFAFLSTIRSAQERYQARSGIYATKVGDLDIQMSPPKYFRDESGAEITATTAIDTSASVEKEPSWTLTLKRDKDSSSYGEYSVVFTEKGVDATNSTVVTDVDLNSRINPVSN